MRRPPATFLHPFGIHRVQHNRRAMNTVGNDRVIESPTTDSPAH
ncbi:hypothetical protein [Rosistilla oblonga]|nr:hypothetical protein [Rosistilla oblonga]